MVIGWAEEPALAGALNAVEVRVTDASGGAVPEAQIAVVNTRTGIAIKTVADIRSAKALGPISDCHPLAVGQAA